METITVYKEIKSQEKIELEIEDIRNCFLKGRDKYYNTQNFLGIWIDKDGLKIIEIRKNLIGVERCENSSISTRIYIETFIKNNNNVQLISKKTFRKEIDKIINILGGINE